jgi:hypothetical protein
LVAKIASDFKKPYGLTVVKEDDVKGFLFPLDVRKIPGAGAKIERILKELKAKVEPFYLPPTSLCFDFCPPILNCTYYLSFCC